MIPCELSSDWQCLVLCPRGFATLGAIIRASQSYESTAVTIAWLAAAWCSLFHDKNVSPSSHLFVIMSYAI
jgi:hypothetical protein